MIFLVVFGFDKLDALAAMPLVVSGLDGLGFGWIKYRACHRHHRASRVVFVRKRLTNGRFLT